MCCVNSRMSKLAGYVEIVCPGLILDYLPTLDSEVKTQAEEMPPGTGTRCFSCSDLGFLLQIAQPSCIFL